MPTYSERNGRVRAQLMVGGKRLGKTFYSREDAERWAVGMKEFCNLRKRGMSPRHPAFLPPQRWVDAVARAHVPASEIVNGAICASGQSGIYFLIKNFEIIYVGQSKNVLKRVMAHRMEGKSFDAFNFIPCPPEDLDAVESDYIAAFMPTMNHRFGNVA